MTAFAWHSKSRVRNVFMLPNARKDSRTALQYVKQGLAINDHDKLSAMCYYEQGIAYQHTENYDSALAAYDKGVLLDSNNSYLYNNRGVVLCKMHDFNKALANLDRSIALEGSSSTFNNRATCKQNMGDDAGAHADFAKAIELEAEGK